MQTVKLARQSYSLLMPSILLSGTLLILSFAAQAIGQPTGQQPSELKPPSPPDVASPSNRFTGSLKVRQRGGSLYYRIYVVDGTVVGGYDTWQGSSKHHHRIVGGWYDRDRMVLLIQSTQNDFGNKWYSQSHHFEQRGNEFVITQTLHGFGRTIDSGGVFTPHTIDEISEMPAEQVRQLARSVDRDSLPPAKPDQDVAALTERIAQLERDNTQLTKSVEKLGLRNTELEDELQNRELESGVGRTPAYSKKSVVRRRIVCRRFGH